MKSLVIVESGAKAKVIANFLNGMPELTAKYGTFTVVACFGHIADLKKKELSIDIEDDFKPIYEVYDEKKQLVAELGKKIKAHDMIFLATDLDNDGSQISWCLREVFNLKKNKYKRMTFNEITKPALKAAVLDSGDIDMDQVYAQQARRTIDRIVGFKLSPLLWSKFTTPGATGLSAGRVQSALLDLIVQREEQIGAFTSKAYWHFNGDFVLTIGKDKTEMDEVRLYKDGTIHKTHQETDVKKFFGSLKDRWTVSDVKSRTTTQKPDAPFITSSLQQAASAKLKMGIKRVMAVAQELYEAGKITYMRTDSYNMSEQFKDDAKKYIVSEYGEQYHSGGVLKKANKSAQEAHECIRATHVEETELEPKFGKEQRDLYKLVWQRSVAFLMKPAIYDELEIDIADAGMPKNMDFVSTFKKVRFNGYLAVYGVQNETNDFDKYLAWLRSGKYALACKEIKAKNTWQSPPARYNESGLVKLMEQEGIGRPSTFSATIDKILQKNYAIKTDVKGEEKTTTDYAYDPKKKTVKPTKGTTFVGSEQAKVRPTEIGIQIDKFLKDRFPNIVDKGFTANMESELDKISTGSKAKLTVLNEFWRPFSKALAKQQDRKEEKTKVQAESTELVVDGTPYTLRIGMYGPLAQYDDPNGKKSYIGLKGYLGMVKKDYLNMDEHDIRFLVSLPKKMGTVKGKDAMLHSGPFGLYLKHDGNNVRIPRFAIKDFLETKTLTNEQLAGFVQYAIEHPKADKTDKTESKTTPTKPTKKRTQTTKPTKPSKSKGSKA